MKNKTLMKTLSAFLAVIIFIFTAPVTGFGLDGQFSINASALTYSGKCGDNIDWLLDAEEGILDITGTGDMTDYTYSSSPWYSYRSFIKNVKIQKGITSIGNYAFRACDNLTSITIPDSVSSIGSFSFSDCEGLITIEIPEGVESIGVSAFYGCINLTSITIPDSVASIGVRAFYGCENITSFTVDADNENYSSDDCGALYNKDKTNLIQYPAGNLREVFAIPAGVKNIEDYSFYWSDSLTTVTFPESVTNIGGSAFHGCTNLTSLEIPEGVTGIGNDAFFYCGSLVTVAISASVANIGDCAFYGCSSLESFSVDADNENYSSDDYGVLYNKEKTKIIQYPAGNSRETFTMPESVEIIGEDAFYQCESLTTINISEKATNIGNSAFYGCSSLEKITIPENVTSVGSNAFNSCSSLSSITISARDTSIGNYVFMGCNAIEEVYYAGTEDEWEQILNKNGNGVLINVKVYYDYNSADKICIILTDSYGNVVSEEFIDSDLNEYIFENVPDGEYKVTVSKTNYVTRTYELISADGKINCIFSLNLIGDIDGNGKVNVTDYTSVLKHVKKTSALEGYAFRCADVNGDGKINVTDYSAILRHVKKTGTLW